MSTYSGKKLKIEVFGESHSKSIGGSVKGLPTFKIDEQKLLDFLDRRKAKNSVFSTSRVEDDLPIFSGIENGFTTDNIKFEIENKNTRSKDYNNLYGKPRPSHADYAWYMKDGTLDFSGGGRFSGRLTAPLCVIGGICKQYLESKGIFVSAYIYKTGGIKGLSYRDKKLTFREIENLRQGDYPALSNKQEMLNKIAENKKEGDSVGGQIDCVIDGLKAGFGDNLFGGLEGKISNLIYSVPAVKGVECGLGFDFASSIGSRINDELYYNEKGDIDFYSNNAGGINGGISNGNQITMSVAMRPTSSILREQRSVDLVKKENVKIAIEGRHDACIVPRAVPVIESVVAIAILDEIL